MPDNDPLGAFTFDVEDIMVEDNAEGGYQVVLIGPDYQDVMTLISGLITDGHIDDILSLFSRLELEDFLRRYPSRKRASPKPPPWR